MDQQKLRTLVFEKTGVRIDIDDPVFALVALNEAVLAEAVERHVALLDAAGAELAEQARALYQLGPSAPRESAERATAPANSTAPSLAPSAQEKRIVVIAAGAALLGALLVLLGQSVLSPVVVRELSAEQSAALREAEKLSSIIGTLDAKTRKTIATQMQQP
jgi:hypothetical protein